MSLHMSLFVSVLLYRPPIYLYVCLLFIYLELFWFLVKSLNILNMIIYDIWKQKQYFSLQSKKKKIARKLRTLVWIKSILPRIFFKSRKNKLDIKIFVRNDLLLTWTETTIRLLFKQCRREFATRVNTNK